MVKPAYNRTIRKKRKHRAGKKTRANRRASNLIWINPQAFGAQSHAESTEKISLTPAISTLTSQSEILIGPPQETFNLEVELNTKNNNNNSNIKLPVSNNPNGLKPYSPELTAFEELHQNIIYQKESSEEVNQIKILLKDLISQLKSQLSEDKHFNIDQYARYLDS